MTQTAILNVTPNKLGCLGWSVSISGPVILAGDDCTNGKTGVAYVFVKPPSGWQDSSKFAARLSIEFPYKEDQFGESVAISGETGAVGAPRAGDVGPGEAFIFTAQ